MINCFIFLTLAIQSQVPSQMDEIMLMASKISNEFSDVSNELLEVAISDADITQIDKAVAKSQELTESMEELLAMLPSSPPQSSSSSSSSSPPSSSSPDPGMPDSQHSPMPPSDDDLNGPPRQIPSNLQNGEGRDGANGNGKRSPEMPSSIFQQQQQFGNWGQLPPRLEQALQHSDVDNMPLRYRRLLVKYHRQATEPLQ